MLVKISNPSSFVLVSVNLICKSSRSTFTSLVSEINVSRVSLDSHLLTIFESPYLSTSFLNNSCCVAILAVYVSIAYLNLVGQEFGKILSSE
jgi:hypothetical protein